MILKIIAGLLLIVATYCQDHHGHTFSLQTLVTHEVPKKVENNHYHKTEYKVVPVHKHVAQVATKSSGHAVSSQSLTHHASHEHVNEILHNDILKRVYFTPQEPAPVYESQEPVRVPVQLKIVQQTVPHAPTQHRVLQLVKQIPIKPQVIKVAPIIPVIHQAPIAPIIHQAAIAPVIQLSPIQHPAVQISHQAPILKHVVEVSHKKPIQHDVTKLTHVPVYHEPLHNTETYYKESHKESHDDHHEHHVDYYVSFYGDCLDQYHSLSNAPSVHKLGTDCLKPYPSGADALAYEPAFPTKPDHGF
ncbi:unnamed protein product [Arctia plantaginis]|uniref:Uncharacterized protein n=1 Tax=Arctia plantaginis TaxID=874455 RepID=A0A8S1AC98_ARCPL|nr:unnamed protein product [Arctia plantaginis]